MDIQESSVKASSDVQMEFQCLGHWVKRLERYLHISSNTLYSQDPTWKRSSKPLEQLQYHMEVQSTIEKLVCRLADLKRRCSSTSPAGGSDHASGSRSTSGLAELQLHHTASFTKFASLEKRLKYCWIKSLEKQEAFLRENFTDMAHDEQTEDADIDFYLSYQPIQKCRRLTKNQSIHDSAPVSQTTLYSSFDDDSVRQLSAELILSQDDEVFPSPQKSADVGSNRIGSPHSVEHETSECNTSRMDHGLPVPVENRTEIATNHLAPASNGILPASRKSKYIVRSPSVTKTWKATQSRTQLKSRPTPCITCGHVSQKRGPDNAFDFTASRKRLPDPRRMGGKFQSRSVPRSLRMSKNALRQITGRSGSERKSERLDWESVFWDDYQVQLYPSDAYSETSLDEASISRITDFGDDYSASIPVAAGFPFVPLGPLEDEPSDDALPSQTKFDSVVRSTLFERLRPGDQEAGQVVTGNTVEPLIAHLKASASTPSDSNVKGRLAVSSSDEVLFGSPIEELILHCRTLAAQANQAEQRKALRQPLSQCLQDKVAARSRQNNAAGEKENSLLNQLDFLSRIKQDVVAAQRPDHTGDCATSCQTCTAFHSFITHDLDSLLHEFQSVLLAYREQSGRCQDCDRLMSNISCQSPTGLQSTQFLPDLVRREKQSEDSRRADPSTVTSYDSLQNKTPTSVAPLLSHSSTIFDQGDSPNQAHVVPDSDFSRKIGIKEAGSAQSPRVRPACLPAVAKRSIRISWDSSTVIRNFVFVTVLVVFVSLLSGMYLVEPQCCTFSSRRQPLYWPLVDAFSLVMTDVYSTDRPF